MEKLNPKQQLFCEHYAITRNGTKSAELAGYSSNSAKQQGSRLLTNVDVKTKIADLLEASEKENGITLGRVMNELASVSFANMSDHATWTKGKITLTPSDKLSEQQLKAVESIAETSDKNGKPQLRIKLHSKLRALEGLLKVYEIQNILERIEALEERLGK